MGSSGNAATLNELFLPLHFDSCGHIQYNIRASLGDTGQYPALLLFFQAQSWPVYLVAYLPGPHLAHAGAAGTVAA